MKETQQYMTRSVRRAIWKAAGKPKALMRDGQVGTFSTHWQAMMHKARVEFISY